MMQRSKMVMWLLLAALTALLALPIAAQEEDVAITATFGAGPATFSPIYCTATDCSDIVGYLFVGLVAVDPVTQSISPTAEGGLAKDWTVSEDNLTYTITLRDDIFWSDGEPINADDVIYNYELMQNADVGHPVAYILEEFASVTKIDDFTLEIVMKSPSCSALNNIGGLRPIPSQVFSQFAPADLETIEFNTAPTVTAGQFTFGQYRSGELTTLITDPNYFDAPEGGSTLDGFIQLVSTDATVLLEQLLAGEINFLESISATQQDIVREAEGLQVYEYPGNTWDYLAFNLADPENPQPALDESGARVEQGIHPIFGDKLVRQALGHAVDVDAMIEGALFGNGTRMPAHITPASWALNTELAPRAFDTALAAQLLDEAGWPMGPDGVRICDGCLYAETVDASYAGTPFEFELLTNAGNTRREAIGTIVQEQLADLGVTVNFQGIEFNTLLEVMDTQSYDAFILGWRAAFPDRPDTIQLFGAAADAPGSGNNFTSFYNEEYYALEEQADTVPGCDQAARAVIYGQMQEIMYDEMPYLWLFSQNGMYAATDNVTGFSPYPNVIDWNILEWTVAAE
ncbi:MAG: ABC transporter substrate-binding protein [Phototrophicaceae bacterium]